MSRVTRTKQEQQAYSAGRNLAKALLGVEYYDGDPVDVIEEARIFLSAVSPGREGAELALDWLEDGYDGEYDKE